MGRTRLLETPREPDDRRPDLLSAPVSAALVARRALQGALLHGLLKLRGLLLLPVLARALGPANLGIVTLAGTLCTLLSPLLTLGAPLGASLVLPGLEDPRALARAFSSIAKFTLAAAAAGSGLVLLLLLLPARPAALAPLGPHAPALVAWLFVASLRELAALPPSLRQESGYLLRLNLLIDYGGAALAVAAVFLGGGPDAVLLAFAAGHALGVLPALLRSWRLCGFAPGLDGEALRATLANGMPFVAIALGQWALQSLDSLFLSAWHGAAAVGVYGVAYSIASATLLVMATVNFVFYPTAVSLARAAPGKLLPFFETSFRLVASALGLLLAEAVLLGPWLVELLAGRPYAEAGRVLPWIVLAYGMFTYMQLLQFVPMVVARRSAPAAAAYLPAVLLNAALNLLLVPRYALQGAAAATVLSYAAALLVMGRLAGRILPEFARWAPLARCVPSLGLGAALALALRAEPGASPWQAAAAALGLAAAYLPLALATGALRRSDWARLRPSA